MSILAKTWKSWKVKRKHQNYWQTPTLFTIWNMHLKFWFLVGRFPSSYFFVSQYKIKNARWSHRLFNPFYISSRLSKISHKTLQIETVLSQTVKIFLLISLKPLLRNIKVGLLPKLEFYRLWHSVKGLNLKVLTSCASIIVLFVCEHYRRKNHPFWGNFLTIIYLLIMINNNVTHIRRLKLL